MPTDSSFNQQQNDTSKEFIKPKESLYEVRTRHGFTQKEIAELISVDQSTIGHEERGSKEKRLNLEKRKELENLFGTPIIWKPIKRSPRKGNPKISTNDIALPYIPSQKEFKNLQSEIESIKSQQKKVNSYLNSCWAKIKGLEESLPSIHKIEGQDFLVFPIPTKSKKGE